MAEDPTPANPDIPGSTEWELTSRRPLTMAALTVTMQHRAFLKSVTCVSLTVTNGDYRSNKEPSRRGCLALKQNVVLSVCGPFISDGHTREPTMEVKAEYAQSFIGISVLCRGGKGGGGCR
jgi:hypothetical protein